MGSLDFKLPTETLKAAVNGREGISISKEDGEMLINLVTPTQVNLVLGGQ